MVAQGWVHSGFDTSRDGDSTATLGNLYQCSTTLTVKVLFPVCFPYLFSCNMPLCWKGKRWCALPPTCFECAGFWKSCSQRCLNLCSLQDRRNLNKWLFSVLFDLSANVSQLKWISLPNWVNLNVCWMSLKVVHKNKTSRSVCVLFFRFMLWWELQHWCALA